MDDLESRIRSAWQRVCASFHDHPDDLARRLARRRTPTLTCPPRAWCLAVRASDRRLPRAHAGDTVTLTADLLRRICAPVKLPAPGLMLDEAAALLGTTPMGLKNARLAGTLRTRHIKGLAGRRGKPVPLVYTDQPLDPCARRFVNPDRAWLWTARWLIDRIPTGFHQTLTRIERYRSHVRRDLYSEHRHPELDDVPTAPKSKRLPPPEPDYVWYKWSKHSGHYLGDDPKNWRNGPGDDGERPPRWLPKKKSYYKPRPSRSTGSLHRADPAWICPVCQRPARTLYLPLPAPNLLGNAVPRLAQVVDIPRRVDGFACTRCHRILSASRIRSGAWNFIISYLTQGLLYGREVPRPSWYTPDRIRAYKPMTNPRPAVRREQVRDLLLQGLPHGAICAKLKMTRAALDLHIHRICKQAGVHGPRALMLKHRLPIPPHLRLVRDEVLAWVRAGDSVKRIAARLGVAAGTVHGHLRALRRAGQLPAPPRPRPVDRAAIARLRAAGLSHQAIGRRLGIGRSNVTYHLAQLRRSEIPATVGSRE